eukprot:COSAG03_NODE_18321_length_357_cov_1.325581_1_plen_54_part_01
MVCLRRSTIALLVVTSALAALSAVCAAAASSTRTPPHEPVADAGDLIVTFFLSV